MIQCCGIFLLFLLGFSPSLCLLPLHLLATTDWLYLFQFEKPGRREDFDYPDMAKEAGLFV